MAEPYRGAAPVERTCLRCNVELTAILVLDRTEGGVGIGLGYTLEAPDKSIWSGAVRNHAGVVRAYMCPRCRLVMWYASPGAPPETA